MPYIPGLALKTPPLPMAPGDPLGLEAWAASCGLPTHVALALFSAIYGGLPGDHQILTQSSPLMRSPGLNLATLGGEIRLLNALGDLTGVINVVQNALFDNSRNFPKELLDKVMYDPTVSNKNRWHVSQLGDGASSPYGPIRRDATEYFHMDTDRMIQGIRYEALTRPQMAFTGVLPSPLSTALSQCHNGIGLAMGCVEHLPQKPQARNKRVAELLRAYAGIFVDCQKSRPHVHLAQQKVRLAGIVCFPSADIARLLMDHRELLSAAVPIIASEPLPSSVDAELVEFFLRRHRFMAKDLMALRRDEALITRGFSEPRHIESFQSRQREYLRDLDATDESCRIVEAAKLPAAMAWALLFYASGEPVCDYILDTVFEASRRIVADAVRLFREHDQQELTQRRLEVARKIFKRLAKIGPNKRRELVRGLDQQSLTLHEPVIAALLQAGILTESQDRVLDVGLVPISKLQPSHLLSQIP